MLDPETQSVQSQVGLKIVKDYFESRLWRDCALESTHEKRVFLEAIGLELPRFEYGMSLAGIADALRYTDNLVVLTKAVLEHSSRRTDSYRKLVAYEEEGLPTDAFDLWYVNYEMHDQDDAARRISRIQSTFDKYVYSGMPNHGVRLLDHGVCSGLLLLLLATFYYRMRYMAEDRSRSSMSPEQARVIRKFINRPTYDDYDPLFWWHGIVWATGAVAMHNIQQQERPWVGRSPARKLRITEDPLAYLGILVDCLQEWDRYSVFPVPGVLPIQATDVELGCQRGVVTLRFENADQARRVSRNLNIALADWDDIVAILP